eukprot:Hpha_TRINITY_DN9293_c0_g1::TRINITY_DN9293_c0_g1_i2::g.28639::m.28639
MLRCSRRGLYPFFDRHVDPQRFHAHWAASKRVFDARHGWLNDPDERRSHVPQFSNKQANHRYIRHLGGDTPLENKVRCPWCHTYFDFTVAEFRRDDTLQDQLERHMDTHSPPPGWEPDPRPMKGKGVTQYDPRHRYGWMLGEEW